MFFCKCIYIYTLYILLLYIYFLTVFLIIYMNIFIFVSVCVCVCYEKTGKEFTNSIRKKLTFSFKLELLRGKQHICNAINCKMYTEIHYRHSCCFLTFFIIEYLFEEISTKLLCSVCRENLGIEVSFSSKRKHFSFSIISSFHVISHFIHKLFLDLHPARACCKPQ